MGVERLTAGQAFHRTVQSAFLTGPAGHRGSGNGRGGLSGVVGGVSIWPLRWTVMSRCLSSSRSRGPTGCDPGGSRAEEPAPSSASVAGLPRSSGAAAVLRQQLERLSMTWPYNGEVAPVECGDPDRAMPLGQGDDGRIRLAEPQISVGADQVLDTLPVGYAEIGHLQLAIDDGRVQAGFRLSRQAAGRSGRRPPR